MEEIFTWHTEEREMGRAIRVDPGWKDLIVLRVELEDSTLNAIVQSIPIACCAGLCRRIVRGRIAGSRDDGEVSRVAFKVVVARAQRRNIVVVSKRGSNHHVLYTSLGEQAVVAVRHLCCEGRIGCDKVATMLIRKCGHKAVVAVIRGEDEETATSSGLGW